MENSDKITVNNTVENNAAELNDSDLEKVSGGLSGNYRGINQSIILDEGGYDPEAQLQGKVGVVTVTGSQALGR